MMTLLLDSSFRGLAVGIAQGEHIVDFIEYDAWQRQSELLVPEMEKLLERNHLSKNDIADVMVSTGPGSYTGVRIALTIAKVVAFALDVPLYSVSSLQVLKMGSKPTIVLINARSGRSYVGVYQGEKVLIQDTIWTNDEVKVYVSQHPHFLISGDTQYLGFEGHTVDPLPEMLSLKKHLEPVKNKLGLTPVYLKD
jgi:tRNA threonylcarbamoyladenosine biosynthesis protein TsaB